MFSSWFISDWSSKRLKIFFCSFQQCLGPFNILIVEECSQTGPFRHFSTESVIPEIRHVWGWSFFSKWPIFLLVSDMQQKIERIIFVFLDNCILIGCGILSLLSSAVNMLRNSSKMSTMTKRKLFQPNFSQSDQTKR